MQIKNKISHLLDAPYPHTTPKGKVIMASICKCGKSLDEHEDLCAGMAYGQGACKQSKCKKFVWSHFETEAKN